MNAPDVTARRWQVIDLAGLPPTDCPCGSAQRALTDCADSPISVHRVEIRADARVHYHRRHTEIYYILECAADSAIELDGERISVSTGQCVLIPPGVRHRAIGRMTVLNLVSPPFDPEDEWFD